VVYRYNLVQKSIFVFRTQLGQEQQKSGVTTHDHQEQITGENCNDFLSDAVGACGLGGPFFNGFRVVLVSRIKKTLKKVRLRVFIFWRRAKEQHGEQQSAKTGKKKKKKN
jgi:hypothetical protein